MLQVGLSRVNTFAVFAMTIEAVLATSVFGEKLQRSFFFTSTAAFFHGLPQINGFFLLNFDRSELCAADLGTGPTLSHRVAGEA